MKRSVPAFAALLAVCATTVYLAQAPAQAPARPPRPGVKTPGVRIPMSLLKPDAVFEAPGTPDWIVIDESVWVSNKPRNNVARLDPKTNKVIEMVTVGVQPCSGLTAGFGSLWVPNCGDKTISRVDLKTGKVTATLQIPIADSEGGLSSGAGSVWVMTDKKSTLARIDPSTDRIVAEIQLQPGSNVTAFGEGSVWVTSTETNVLTRVDPQTNLVVASIPVGKSPRFLTVGGGFVWTLNQAEGNVSKVDPKTNKVVAMIEVGIPGGGGEISFGEGSVWITSFEFPISRIDAATDKVVQQFAGPGGDAIRYGLGSIWLSNLREGNIWRLDPKRIMATVAP